MSFPQPGLSVQSADVLSQKQTVIGDQTPPGFGAPATPTRPTLAVLLAIPSLSVPERFSTAAASSKLESKVQLWTVDFGLRTLDLLRQPGRDQAVEPVVGRESVRNREEARFVTRGDVGHFGPNSPERGVVAEHRIGSL